MPVRKYCLLEGPSRAAALAAALLGICFTAAAPALAVERIYDVVPSQSSVTVSGNLVTLLGTAVLQPQGPGSLTTTYAGTIRADRGANSFQFLAGSSIDANVNGNWRPLANGGDGSEPADYGGTATRLVATSDFAAHDLVADLSSGALPLAGDGSFDLSTVLLNFTNGNFSYRGNLATGMLSLIGLTSSESGTGSLTSALQTETLTLPINVTISALVATQTTLNLSFTGQLVATASLPPTLPGDYNENGSVDAADFIVWRNNNGSSTSLPNDDSPGVGPDDYDRWRTHFGTVSSGIGAGSGAAGYPVGAAAGSLSAGVPEPSATALTAISAIACSMWTRMRTKRVRFA